MFASLVAMRQVVVSTHSRIAYTKLKLKVKNGKTTSFNSQAHVRLAVGTDEGAVRDALQGLLKTGGKGGRWTLTRSGKGLERSFRFKSFTRTWVSL